MNNKTIIEFGFRNTWRIMKVSVGVIRLGLAFSTDNTLLDLHNFLDDTQPHSIIAKYAFLLAMELEKLPVNNKIRASCPTNVSRALLQTLETTKMKERKMVNFKPGETNVTMKWSACHDRGTKKKSESLTGFEPMTSQTPLREFSVAQVDRAPARCLGGYRFESCRGLRIFLCPTLVTCWSFHCNKNELCKTVRLTSFQKTTTAIRFNLLQDCLSLATFPFATLFIPSFHVCSSYFHVSLSFVAVLTVLFSFVKFRDASPLSCILFYSETPSLWLNIM